tara:strand:+ start:1025 stop:1216 length:192 start_codon:yes stop_codon:yes gene_type:complete
MSIPATNRSMFNQSETQILERGLRTMSLACDALSDQNESLKEENKELLGALNSLKEEILANGS